MSYLTQERTELRSKKTSTTALQHWNKRLGYDRGITQKEDRIKAHLSPILKQKQMTVVRP
jgi:hypothetical protein